MSTLQVERIDLAQDQIEAPSNAFVILEGRFGVASYSEERPSLLTRDLITCKMISFYRPEVKKGLLAHLYRIPEGSLGIVIGGLVTAFNEDLTGSDVHIVVGSDPEDSIRDGYESHQRFAPSWEQIADEILKHQPRRVLVDAEYRGSRYDRCVALFLGNGEVKEVDRKVGRYFESQDYSLSQPYKTG